MRKLLILSGFTLTWAISATPVLAFEQTPVASELKQAPMEGKIKDGVDGGGKSTGSNHHLELDSKEKSRLTIPGFGSFGIFPKFNFGLELLYSDPSRDSGAEAVAPDSETDDVKIRGTLKKRF